METISAQRKHVSDLKPYKNPRRRSSRGSLSRSGGSLALPINPTASWGSYPTPPPSYSQPPLLPLPRVNNTLNSVSQTKPTSGTNKKKVAFVESVPTLTRTGSVPVRSNFNFPNGFDGYPGPAIMLLSPPPSSLPMPRFFIKQKLRCNVEAAGKNKVASH